MNIISLFSGCGGLDLGFKKQDLTLLLLTNMIKVFGQPLKPTIIIPS
ncbi:hypothetical protein E9M_05783 [Moraxella catarrhalis 46P47B1]|jgi:hypothetical protein|nr:putative cytosine-specific methyltransferase [Moraxella catarrhalis]AZQ91073.1 putative cytosine-specific methyltransferase [Moraxella catarrhalis]EGE11954.1 hypothetical protein E9M_05783 [Moraxella catarrhalis 46P47B1]EGE22738.1 hypothetical protein E9S_00345 [Moraxella catarrhalis BC7]